ncbi:hypothetical Protein YC6258_03061 [Gynuella sunshinyii YC6258]|uniref:Uncharacterized protein n=1 Tax=Gynuella sunshinyii YC6258 TaxID=1445510 RepID=A0A0C5VK78_9GAMM|nr:hypothetical Protein YC6258_03061 [Gynuella sunshinyii YC6258]
MVGWYLCLVENSKNFDQYGPAFIDGKKLYVREILFNI